MCAPIYKRPIAKADGNAEAVRVQRQTAGVLRRTFVSIPKPCKNEIVSFVRKTVYRMHIHLAQHVRLGRYRCRSTSTWPTCGRQLCLSTSPASATATRASAPRPSSAASGYAVPRFVNGTSRLPLRHLASHGSRAALLSTTVFGHDFMLPGREDVEVEGQRPMQTSTGVFGVDACHTTTTS